MTNLFFAGTAYSAGLDVGLSLGFRVVLVLEAPLFFAFVIVPSDADTTAASWFMGAKLSVCVFVGIVARSSCDCLRGMLRKHNDFTRDSIIPIFCYFAMNQVQTVHSFVLAILLHDDIILYKPKDLGLHCLPLLLHALCMLQMFLCCILSLFQLCLKP